MEKIKLLILIFFLFFILNYVSADSIKPELMLDPGGHKSRVNKIIFTNNEKFLISCSDDKTVKIWDISTGECIKTLMGETGAGSIGSLYTIAISPDDTYLAVGGNFAGEILYNEGFVPVRIFNLKTGKIVNILKGHNNAITALEFSKNGQYLASSSFDASIIIWDVKNDFSYFHKLSYHKGAIRGLSFSPDSKLLASASEDKSIALWNVSDGNLISDRNPAENLEIRSIDFTSDGKYLASASTDGFVLLWNALNITPNSVVHQIDQYAENLKLKGAFDKTLHTNKMKISPDSKYIAFGGNYYEEHGKDKWLFPIYFYNISSKKIDKTIWNHTNVIDDIVFSKSGKYFAAAGGNENEIVIYDGKSLDILQTLVSKGSGIFSIAYGKDGNNIYFGNSNQSAAPNNYSVIDRSFSLIDLTVNKAADTSYTRVYDSVDGNVIEFLPGISGKNIKIGSILFSVTSMTDTIRCYTFTPDGKYVIIGTDEELLKIDAKTGAIIGNFISHNGAVWSVSVSPDSKYLVSGSADQTIKLWDINKLVKIKDYNEYQVNIVIKGSLAETSGLQQDDVIYKVDNKFFRNQYELLDYLKPVNKIYTFNILRKNKEITLTINKTSPGFGFGFNRKLNGIEPIVTCFISKNGEYLVWTPDNYYTGDKKLFQYVGWYLDQGPYKEAKFYPFEQFDLKFNRPDIVLKRMGFADKNIIEAYLRLHEKRLQKSGFKEEDLSGEIHTPEVSMETDINNNVTGKNIINLYVKAMDSLYILDKINIYINDVPLYGIIGIPLKEKKLKEYSQTFAIPLLNGKNKIQFSAVNQNGVESLKETMDIFCKKTYKKPDLFIATIGVSKYKNSSYDLQYSDKDSNDLIQVYKKNLNFYNEIKTLQMNNEKATKDNIKSIKDFFNKSKSDDYVILFIAGHGIRDDKNEYYFGTYNIDFENPSKNGLNFSELDSLLDGIPALTKLFLMDTCFSGEAEENIKNPEIILNQNVKSRGLKIAKQKQVGNTEKKELVLLKKDIFTNLQNETGAVVISSSSDTEFSYEGVTKNGETINNGVFTYSLISGLTNYQADMNGDKKIQVSEILTWVYKNVTDLTKGLQNPAMKREKPDFDFTIY